MCKSLLEEYKGKVIGIYGFDFDEMKNIALNFKLLDSDTEILKLEKINGDVIFKPLSSINEIIPPDDEETKRFYDYVSKFKQDPSFEGDSHKENYYIKRVNKKNV